MTPEEITIQDYMWTLQDIERLEAIVNGLHGFIVYSGEEDRSNYRVDLIKWQNILNSARSLKTAIEVHAAHNGYDLTVTGE